MNAPFRPAEAVALARLTEYRPFIDGLRAVSIIAVVAYHVGVPGISGGFVGVDVFFVISGFLIISQIVEGLRRGTFSFGEFWARRALRIGPPYLLVLACIVVAASSILVMPDQINEFGKEVGTAAVMVVNHFFLRQQGYFDTAADSKILLNLWSLAVEEQFYLTAPIIIVLTWRLPDWLGRSRLRKPLMYWTSGAVFVLSLAGCVTFTAADRNYAFYLTALRAWEFVAGGAVGAMLPIASRLPERFNAVLTGAGLAAIVGSAFFYTAEMAYPSWRAAVPVFGATALILGGLAYPKGAAVRLLATPPMVWIGLVSYSWYLWHWPLLALGRVSNFGERDFGRDLTLVLASLMFAAATFILVERPIRRWRQQRRKPLGWRPVFAGVMVCCAVAIGGWESLHASSARIEASLPRRYKPEQVEHVPFCSLQLATPEQCNAIAGVRPLGLLIGDSHAGLSIWGFNLFASRHGAALALLASPACAPMLETKVFIPENDMAAACEQLKSDWLAPVRQGKIRPDFAVLYARWPIYANRKGYPLGPLDADQPAADQAAAFVAGVQQTIADLKSWGVRRILVIGPTPQFERGPAECVYLADRNGLNRTGVCGVMRSRARIEADLPATLLSKATAGFDGVRAIDPFDVFCDAERCLPYAGDSILFSDTNHLSEIGALRLAERHAAAFEWAIGARPLRSLTTELSSGPL